MPKITLISTEPSPCCGMDAQIIRSRDGGLISRDCVSCGKSHYVNEYQLPKLPCETCNLAMKIRKRDGTNYFYECSQCGKYYKIADLVPDWREEFRYSGLAAHGDPGLPL